ncbi:MAG: hypothetical protein K6A44_06830 [bacterium]|nr:hypothetical protein [bacterium]
MLNFPVHYKLVFVGDKTGFIASDHEKQTLYISKDLKLSITNDEKLCATFPNYRAKTNGGFGCSSSYHPETDCSVIISDPSVFNYCIQKDGAYQLSGSNIAFKGTTQNDKLVLNECVNSEIDLGYGDDTVKIENSSRPIYFHKNKIRTGSGDDTIIVDGNFKRFTNNEFYLGEGSDSFSANINPNEDVSTHAEFTSKLHKYGSCVSKNEIYAIEGYTGDGDTKGWFENNVFEAKTYSANEITLLDGFQKATYKAEPKQVFKSLTKGTTASQAKKETAKENKKPTDREVYERQQGIYQGNSFKAMTEPSLKKRGEAQLKAIEAVDDMVHSWAK